MPALDKLENTFSWSLSRNRTFNECPRRYWFHYYGAWGGWESDAPPDVRELYLLKNITNLHLIAGDCVHRVIERVLQDLREGRQVFPEASVAWCKTQMQRAFKESQREDWRNHPKRYARLFEHHYGPKPDRPLLERIATKIGTSVRTFFNSECYALIRETDPGEWLTMETLDSFEFEGTKVFAVPDFAVRHLGETLLFDWKTGRKDARNNDQLVLYALFAVQKWGVDLASMRAAPVYLLTGGDFSAKPISPEDVAHVREMMRKSIAEMRGGLEDAAGNAARKEDFRPRPGYACRSCPFRGVCPEAP